MSGERRKPGPPAGRAWAERVREQLAREGRRHKRPVDEAVCAQRPHLVVAGDYSTLWLSCVACGWSWTLYRDGRPAERGERSLPGFPGPDPWPRRPSSLVAPDVPWEWDRCRSCGADKGRRFEACEACGAPAPAPRLAVRA